MTNTPTPEQIAAFLKILGDCAREAAENENPNLEAAFDQIAALVRRPSIRPEMVRKMAIRFGEVYLRHAERVTIEDLGAIEIAMASAVKHALQVQAQGVPEGWKLVPVEPTPQMRQAFHAAHEEYEGGSGVAPDLQWQAMLAAAPLPAPPAEGK